MTPEEQRKIMMRYVAYCQRANMAKAASEAFAEVFGNTNRSRMTVDDFFLKHPASSKETKTRGKPLLPD